MPRPTDQRVSDHVGAVVAETREKRGLSRAELARGMGISEVAMHHYEKGNRRITVDNLFALASLLGKPVSHFYKGLEFEGPDALSPASRTKAKTSA
ncbi:helix-turn-helix protein [Brevundimonas phage vB_BpoS-Kabachok]|uniref:Helix-turn-helix protein n=2 Tax=Marchewkavirus TaxID=3425052 RepID=A0A9E7SJM2_9CAUD|nr:helix-turn-helix protein [Brevundimonas phage vB_BpoS-Kabachok]USN14658.1 helix-turn-helix protein [Brevundimonas phage vB_BpoS-Domovoi]